ncbi:MAG: prealbumin-like fold domain-containing protein [Lachnospiraceae bacterium]|nr:prealbumin-like fold domain-containing protein [Lachnospiraceae bacterium]
MKITKRIAAIFMSFAILMSNISMDFTVALASEGDYYNVVTLTEPSETENATAISGNKTYYIGYYDVNDTIYLRDFSYNDGQDDNDGQDGGSLVGIGRSPVMAGAGEFHFEPSGLHSDGYYVYVLDGETRKYIYFPGVGDSLYLIEDTTETPRQEMRVTTTNDPNNMYDIYQYGTSNHINAYNGSAGVVFARWRDGKVFIRETADSLRDNMGLDGTKAMIVSNGHAMSNEASGDYLQAYDVTLTENISGAPAYTSSLDNADRLIWSFTANDDGTYYIQDLNGKYLNMTGVAEGTEIYGGFNMALTVSDTPQKLMLNYVNGSLEILSFDDLYAYNTTIDYSGGTFKSWACSKNAAPSNRKNSKFALGEIPNVKVNYTYPAPTPEEGDSMNRYQAIADVKTTWCEGYTVSEPASTTFISYSAGYKWIYDFVDFTGSDSNTYNPGDVITSEPENDLTLSANWSYREKQSVSVNVNYEVTTDALVSGDSLINTPVIDGITPVNGVYTDVVTQDASAYAVLDTNPTVYDTSQGRRYKLVGWKTDDDTVIAAGTSTDLLEKAEFAGDGSLYVNLQSVWTEEFRDPWGLDGGFYLIVNNADVYAMSSSAKNSGKLDRYAVTNEVDYYSSASEVTIWNFEANDNGTYYIYTNTADGTRFLNMGNGNSSLTTSQTSQEFRLYKTNNKYYIVGHRSGNDMFMLDYYSGGEFGDWSKTQYNPDNNNLFTLGNPAGLIRYVYDIDNRESGDEGSYTMPLGFAEQIGVGSAIKSPESTASVEYVDGEGYYLKTYSMSKVYRYRFTGWYGSDGNTYQPADVIDTMPEGELVLTSMWEFADILDSSLTVKYNVYPAEGTTVDSAGLPYFIGDTTITGDRQNGYIATQTDIGSVWLEYYDVSELASECYHTTANVSDEHATHVLQFDGWRTEGGTIVEAQSVVNLTDTDLSGNYIFDSNNDGVVNLYATWSNRYDTANSSGYDFREAKFYISLKATSSDVFNTSVSTSTNADDFAPAVFHTIIMPKDVAPDVNSGTTAYKVVSYGAEVGKNYDTTTDITEANEQIRMLGGDGYTYEGVTYKALEFPTDAQVMEYLRSLDTDGDGILNDGAKFTITLNDAPVTTDTLTVDNYTIRWYCYKMQGDGWHIDGKLTPNVHYITVTKTFSGDSTAMSKVVTGTGADAFNIQLTNNDDTSDVVTLYLEQGNQKYYGLIDKDENGKPITYGYMEKSGNTYTWVVPTAAPSTFNILENNYNVSDGETDYGIAAQYSITNLQAGSGATEVPLQQWFSTVQGTTASYAADAVDIGNSQKVNLYNTYVKSGTFIVQKRDRGTDFAPMPGVRFSVYEIMDDDSLRLLTVSKKSAANINDGRYTVLYDNGNTSDVVITGTDGNIYLSLPIPQGVGNVYRYKFIEQVPNGYREGSVTPSFVVTVDEGGGFTVSDMVYDSKTSGMSTVSVGDPGQTPVSTVGITVYNEPIRIVSITAEKVWECAPEESVTFVLEGTACGRTYVSETIVLKADGAYDVDGIQKGVTPWSYTWYGKPLVIGNEAVKYTVTETYIGDHLNDSEAFKYWLPKNFAPVYRDENGVQLENDGADVAAADVYKVRQIHFAIENDRQKSSVVTIRVNKISAFDGTFLPGAKFEVYRQDASSSDTITFRGETIYVKDRGYVSTVDGLNLKFERGKTYYLKEIYTPSEYVRVEGMFKVSVGNDGVVTLETEDTLNGYISYQVSDTNPLYGTLTIKNIPIEISVFKVSGVEDALEGAHFALYKANGNVRDLYPIEGYEDIVTGSDGLIYAGALKPGIYHLVETRAPDGYSILHDTTVLVVSGTTVSAVRGSDVITGIPVDTVEGGIVVKRHWTINIVNDAEGIVAPTGIDTSNADKAFAALLVLSGLALLGIYILSRRRKGVIDYDI